MTATATSRDFYLAEFARLQGVVPGHRLPWMRRARDAAIARFADAGFPTARQEDWKYTNVAAIEKGMFAPAVKSPLASPFEQIPPIPPLTKGGAGEISSRVEEFALGDACHRLVFVNGHFVPELSRLLPLPAGVKLGSLASVLQTEPQAVESYLAGYSTGATNGFTALNMAFMQDGACIYLPRGVALEQPVQLLFLAASADQAAHVHNLVVAENGAQATIVETYGALNGAQYWTNAVTRIVAAEGAAIEHYKLQQESPKAFHIATLEASQGAGSSFISHSHSLGGLLTRNDINVAFDAEGGECTLNGLYLVGGRQHVDFHTRIDHLKPRCTSREYYRGVLDGAARGVFNGKVVVHPDAQHTDAHQANNNLLLSREAEVDTKPQLEIYADDVKCSHGATVGQLDENMVFYLRSRGVAEAAARSLLIFAFANDVISRIKVAPLREKLSELLIARVPHGEIVKELL